jgi:hypothetical protein
MVIIGCKLHCNSSWPVCHACCFGNVEVSATREGYLVTPQEILRRARAKDLYPPKTTRYRFPSALPTCNVSVWLLRRTSDS